MEVGAVVGDVEADPHPGIFSTRRGDRGGTRLETWQTPRSSWCPSTTPTPCSRCSTGRYGHDYNLRSARSCTEAEKLAQELKDGGEPVALFVSDSRLPDVEHMFEAVHRFRVVVPTARRVIAAHWDHFLVDADELGPGWRGASTTPTC